MIKSDARFAASSRFCTDAATVPAIVNNWRTVKSKLKALRLGGLFEVLPLTKASR